MVIRMQLDKHILTQLKLQLIATRYTPWKHGSLRSQAPHDSAVLAKLNRAGVPEVLFYVIDQGCCGKGRAVCRREVGEIRDAPPRGLLPGGQIRTGKENVICG